MAVKTLEDLFASFKEYIGENTDDHALAMLEDMSDTYDDLSNKINKAEVWKSMYEENDRVWREKYRDRFYSNEVKVPEGQTLILPTDINVTDDVEKELTVEDLFEHS